MQPTAQQIQAAINSYNAARLRYDEALEAYLNASSILRLRKQQDLSAAETALNDAESYYRRLVGFAQLPDEKTSYLPIVAVGVIGLVMVAIFIQYLKK